MVLGKRITGTAKMSSRHFTTYHGCQPHEGTGGKVTNVIQIIAPSISLPKSLAVHVVVKLFKRKLKKDNLIVAIEERIISGIRPLGTMNSTFHCTLCIS